MFNQLLNMSPVVTSSYKSMATWNFVFIMFGVSVTVFFYLFIYLFIYFLRLEYHAFV